MKWKRTATGTAHLEPRSMSSGTSASMPTICAGADAISPLAKAPVVGIASPKSAAASSATSVVAQDVFGSKKDVVSFQKAAEK